MRILPALTKNIVKVGSGESLGVMRRGWIRTMLIMRLKMASILFALITCTVKMRHGDEFK